MAKVITPRQEDYSRWYTDVIIQSQMADYSPVKGCMVIRPLGYALWEAIQRELDARFKETGHENAYFPLFIPESFLHKEAEHVAGFAPELAVVTHGGGKELEEALIVRPTSETIIYAMFAKWIRSYRDLPVLINQWANVVRWEMRTRLFLRTTEFLWQEGHTAHVSEAEAEEEALTILEIYRRFAEEHMAIPVYTGVRAHGDGNGVSFPPRLAPLQVVIVPIWKTDEEKSRIAEAARLAAEELKGACRVKVDLRDEVSPGWKFNEWELKGVPLRLEIGPKDLEKDQLMAVRRLDRRKTAVPRASLVARVASLLEEIQKDMLEKGRAFLRENTRDAKDYEGFKRDLDEKGGFFRAPWCGSAECEQRIKDETKATIRCIPLEGNREDGTCLRRDGASKRWVYLARAY